jgi:hypothetical protein
VLIVDNQINRILELADDMASAAASFNSQQGYDQFIRARDSFRKAAKGVCSSCQKKD